MNLLQDEDVDVRQHIAAVVCAKYNLAALNASIVIQLIVERGFVSRSQLAAYHYRQQQSNGVSDSQTNDIFDASELNPYAEWERLLHPDNDGSLLVISESIDLNTLLSTGL
jgi:hypothetical protein